jgi:ABC-type multidrug transport system fused ATPase/permease subunit
MWIAIVVFIAIVAFTIAFSAKFNLSNITSEPHSFFERFFSQWSLALSAAGTIILAISAFSFIYESRRREDREERKAIHALHDEVFWNLNNIITLRFQISEYLKYLQEHNVTPSNQTPFELLETRVFDDMRSQGQLHLLEDIRMEIVPCYKLIRDYNLDREFKPNHLELLKTLHEWLEKGIKDLEAKFKFLPHYMKEKSGKQETKTEKTPQNQLSVSRREFLTTGIIFFLFSLTLYIYGGSPFVFTAWKFTWHAPELVSAIVNGLGIFVLIVGSVISVFCLVGSFLPRYANSLLNMLASHKRLMRWSSDGFVAFFPLAFLLNFFTSWIQKFVGVAKNEIVFFLIFAIGLIWTAAIVVSQERRRR